MASYSAVQSFHKTLSTTTVDTCTFTGNFGEVEITNYDSTNRLYVTIDGTTPTAATDPAFVVAQSSSKVFTYLVGGQSGGNPVKLLGNGNAYSVEGVD